MSLGLRVPNFPISQIMLGHLGWDFLGNLEIGKYIPLPISQIVLGQMGWGLSGNWEIGKHIPLPIPQFPNFPNGAGPSELGLFGKLGRMYL